jgi:hypothetical protein
MTTSGHSFFIGIPKFKKPELTLKSAKMEAAPKGRKPNRLTKKKEREEEGEKEKENEKKKRKKEGKET